VAVKSEEGAGPLLYFNRGYRELRDS